MANRKIQIIIADDEQNICEMLKQLIRFDEMDMELVHMSNDGEDLKKSIMLYRPEIVITDIRMPVTDGLEVIRWCNENGYKTNFVVLSGYHQFEYAYNALKYKVNDYLLKPVNEDELNETLLRIGEKIRKGSVEKDNMVYIHTVHDYFMRNVAHDVIKGRKTSSTFSNLDEINKEFMLNLKPGRFRFIYLIVDDRWAEKRTDEQVTSVIEKLKSMVEKTLAGQCHEHISTEQPRGFKCFINYAPDIEAELERELKNLYARVRALADVFSGMHITMCVGKAVDSPSEIPYASNCAWNTLFCRFGIGTNRIIWYEQLGEADIEEKTKDWTKQIQHAWDVLDEEGFHNVIQEIFSMPRSVEASKEFAVFVKHIDDIVDECRENFCRQTGLDPSGENKGWGGKRPFLGSINSLEEYRDMMIRVYGSQIRECVRLVDKKNLKPIRLACSFVEEHYQEAIKLEDVAEIVNLNPAYFSTLFVRKTGQSFTEYVTLFKIKKACELLTNSDMNINEIAGSLGFPDARYFSKLFRKKMGLKPTEYRRIYG